MKQNPISGGQLIRTKRDTYYIRIAKDLLEVDEAVYLAYYQMGRRERYLEERDLPLSDISE